MIDHRSTLEEPNPLLHLTPPSRDYCTPAPGTDIETGEVSRQKLGQVIFLLTFIDRPVVPPGFGIKAFDEGQGRLRV